MRFWMLELLYRIGMFTPGSRARRAVRWWHTKRDD